jgi:parallel beta-helix repeat protein
MNGKTRMKRIGFAMLCWATCCSYALGTTRIVGPANVPCPNAGFSKIQDAINAAQSGDTIEICPALYQEQLLVTKPLTLTGISEQGVERAVIQPTSFSVVQNLGFTAAIAVVNTDNVTISNLAVDASNNTVSGCGTTLAGIHFYNASGVVDSVAISGTQLRNPLSCTTLVLGNGNGVQADQAATSTSTYSITVRNSSIHDFGRNAIYVSGTGERVMINGNSIAGVGPSAGVNQFGVFVANGASGEVTANLITEGTCGTIPILTCYNLRTEGVVLRSAGNGTIIAGNVISNVQAGVFVNGATNFLVTGNTISNVDALSAIHLQGAISGLISGNRIFHVGPFTADTSNDEEGCGVNDVSGTNSSGNAILGNSVNDAYCGVAYVTGDQVGANAFRNTLYTTLNGDNYPNVFPPPVQPGQ